MRSDERAGNLEMKYRLDEVEDTAKDIALALQGSQ